MSRSKTDKSLEKYSKADLISYIDEDWLSSGKWGGCPNCRAKMDLAPPEGDSHG